MAIRASGNVSSITDNGTGDYTINFTTAMEDANYSWAPAGNDVYSSSGTNSSPSYRTIPSYQTAGSLRINVFTFSRISGSTFGMDFNDHSIITIAIFR